MSDIPKPLQSDKTYFGISGLHKCEAAPVRRENKEIHLRPEGLGHIKLLQLYAESGVDEIISETPINRLARKMVEQSKIEAADEADLVLDKTSLIAPSNSTIIHHTSAPHNGAFDKSISTFNAISKLAQKQKTEQKTDQIDNLQPLRPKRRQKQHKPWLI